MDEYHDTSDSSSDDGGYIYSDSDANMWVKPSKWSQQRRERLIRLFDGSEDYVDSWLFSTRTTLFQRPRRAQSDSYEEELLVTQVSQQQRRYTLIFLKRDEDDPERYVHGDNSDDENDNDNDGDKMGLTDGELRAMAEINDIIDSALSQRDNITLSVDGSATILAELRTIRNLRDINFTNLEGDFRDVGRVLRTQSHVGTVCFDATTLSIFRNGIPEDVSAGLRDLTSLSLFEFHVYPVYETGQSVINKGRWLYEILSALGEHRCRVRFNIQTRFISVATLSALFGFLMEKFVKFSKISVHAMSGMDMICRTPFLRILLPPPGTFYVRPVIEEMHMEWSSEWLAFRDKRAITRAFSGRYSAGDEAMFAREGLELELGHLSLSIGRFIRAFKDDALRVRRLYLGDRSFEAKYERKIGFIDEEELQLLDNYYLERHALYFVYHPRVSDSHRMTLEATCRENLATRKWIDRNVHLLMREARVILFPSKRPRWFLPEVALLVMSHRIRESGFIGEDTKMLIKLLRKCDGRNLCDVGKFEAEFARSCKCICE